MAWWSGRCGRFADEGVDRSRHCDVQIADDSTVVDEFDESPSWNSQASAETNHREPASIAGDVVVGQAVGERTSDAKNVGGLVDCEHRGQVIEVAFEVSGDAHGVLTSTPMWAIAQPLIVPAQTRNSYGVVHKGDRCTRRYWTYDTA